MYKIGFYVPTEQLEQVKSAMFTAGGGRIGNYDCCAWQTLGYGQFRALEGSDPYIGNLMEVERVEEYRVEMVCEQDRIAEVLEAMKRAHPYEEPAYDVIRLERF